MDKNNDSPGPVPQSSSDQNKDVKQSLLACPDSDAASYQSHGNSPAHDCNPEAPPELLNRKDLTSADKIGDTVFSKHWLFTTLMKLIQVVDAQCEGKEEQQPTVDLDENLQDELCKLWDMSMNGEVVNFLQEFKAVDILTGVIAKSQAPRATEICVGILGNMGCNDDACREMSTSSKLTELTELLLSDHDAPTLVETMRLLLTVISNPTHRKVWTDMIKSREEFLPRVTFILSSSTNGDLLRNAAMFLDKLLDVEEELCVSWATNDMVAALLEAAKQIGYKRGEALDALLHVFQLLSTTEQGVKVLVEQGEDLGRLLLQYLLHLCSDEILAVEGHESSFASAFSTLNVIIVSSPDASKMIFQDYELVRCLLKVLNVVYVKLHPECHQQHHGARRRKSRTRSRYHSESQADVSRNEDTDTQKPMTSEAQDNTTSSSDGRSDLVTSSAQEQMTSQTENKTKSETGAGDIGNAGSGVTSQDDKGNHDGGEEDDYDATRIRVLYDVLQMFTQDVVEILTADQREEVARSLLYFETGCSRDRLYAMVWTLVDQPRTTDSSETQSEGALPAKKGLGQVASLRDLAAKHELWRLQGILDDALDLNASTRGL